MTTKEPAAIPTLHTHELKTDPAVFDAVARGVKTHEIRLNDRRFAVGDALLLRETALSGQAMLARGLPVEYTGRTETRTISHIQTGYGLASDWCILSFAATAVSVPGPILSDERAAFEAVASSHGITVERFKQRPDDYQFEHTKAMFAFWQAAWGAARAAVPVNHSNSSSSSNNSSNCLVASVPGQGQAVDHDEAVMLLSAVFDAWENGDDCHEEGDPSGSYMGKCFQLDDDVYKRCCDLLNRLNPPRNVAPVAVDRNAVLWAHKRKDDSAFRGNKVYDDRQCAEDALAMSSFSDSHNVVGLAEVDAPVAPASVTLPAAPGDAIGFVNLETLDFAVGFLNDKVPEGYRAVSLATPQQSADKPAEGKS